MAETMAGLNKRVNEIISLSFPVQNLAIDTAWGSIFYKSAPFNTGLDLTGKKVFSAFNASTDYQVWTYCDANPSGLVSVGLCRATAGTITGTVDLLIV